MELGLYIHPQNLWGIIDKEMVGVLFILAISYFIFRRK